MKCIFNEEQPGHIWTYSGDPNHFPYEGMRCDCGMVQYKDYGTGSIKETSNYLKEQGYTSLAKILTTKQ